MPNGKEETLSKTQAAPEAQEGQAVKTVVRPTQAEASYVTLSAQPGAACANCRWFIGSRGEYGGCHIIDNFPLEIEPTGYCNRYDGPVVVADDGFTAEVAGETETTAPPEPEVEVVERAASEPDKIFYAAPKSSDGLLSGLRAKFSGGLKPGTSVLKGIDGKRYILLVTSNSYEDREEETITTDALKEYVDSRWIADDQYHTDEPTLFWHDDRLQIGDLIWGDTSGPFLVELAREADNSVAKSIIDYLETSDEKWGASHRFAYRKSSRDESGTYHRIYKLETSILPHKFAANIATYSGVLPTMKKERGEILNKMLGEGAAEELDKGMANFEAWLAERGVEHKAVDEPKADATETVEKAATDFAPLLLQLIDGQVELAEQVDARETADKARSTENETLIETLKAVNARLEKLEVQLNARPTIASKDAANIVSEDQLSDEAQRAIADSTTGYNQFWKTELKTGGNS